MTPRQTLLLTRAAICALILLAALGASRALVRLSRKPAQVTPPEPRLAVRTMTAQPGPATARLTAYGAVRPLRTARLSAEVSGILQPLPRTFRTGDLVPEGELLARIDPRDYEIALADARADLAQARTRRERLDIQEAGDRERHTIARRTKTLAESEYLRTKRLFDEETIGSISRVEAAEQALTQAAAQLAVLDQALALYPALRAEADAAVTAAEARIARAELQLERTKLRAPFAGRLTHAAAEPGENVQPGTPLFHLADDQTLEVLLHFDADEVRNWLQFEEAPADDTATAWFPPVRPVPVTLTWSEAARELTWTGTLHRIVSFDSTTRTVTAAVRIDAAAARDPAHPIPLSDGMFCRADLPGRTLKNVYTLPREAVTFDARVHLADTENRLRSVTVDVLRTEEDTVIVRGGISPGDRIITTRLIAPLEGALLDILEN